MVLQLRTYGEFSWSHLGQISPISGQVGASLLVILAENQGDTVSVDALLQRLWPVEPPRSSRNAVQRHVSKLRGQLRGLGRADADQIIVSTPRGYLLSPDVSTDFRELRDAIRRELTLPTVNWQSEPLAGITHPTVDQFRTYLVRTAEDAFKFWSASATLEQAAATAQAMLRRHVVHSPVLESAAAALAPDTGLNPAQQQDLRAILGHWAHSQTEAALDLLQETKAFPSDLSARLCRWLIWLSPLDGWARYCFSLLLEECVVSPRQFERTIATLDGRCFNEMSDGQLVARSEVDAATSELTLLRSLRSEFMAGLANPHCARQQQIVRHLEAIDSPDALVEAQRFGFLNKIRAGDYRAAQVELASYEHVVGQMWPRDGDDFAPMARCALTRSVDPDVSHLFGPARPILESGFNADRMLLSLTTCIQDLITTGSRSKVNTSLLSETYATVPPDTKRALELLYALREGRDVARDLDALAADLPRITRDKMFHLVPIAVGLLADAVGNSYAAQQATAALQPWSSQTLGVWPIDYVFGAADDWLERFGAV